MIRTYVKVEKELFDHTHMMKRSDQLRHWAVRGRRFDSRARAIEVAKMMGWYVVNRWYDATVAEGDFEKMNALAAQVAQDEFPLNSIAELSTQFVRKDFLLSDMAQGVIEDLIDDLIKPEPRT